MTLSVLCQVAESPRANVDAAVTAAQRAFEAASWRWISHNDADHGLAAAVWTRDASRGHRSARALKSGSVWINTYAEPDPVMSTDGYKQSGYGRENGAESIEAYTQTKSVLMRL